MKSTQSRLGMRWQQPGVGSALRLKLSVRLLDMHRFSREPDTCGDAERWMDVGLSYIRVARLPWQKVPTAKNYVKF